MRRRRFVLGLGGAATFAVLGPGCARSTLRVDGGGDGGVLHQDAAPPVDSALALYVIHEAFDVLLNDSTCSHHSHSCRVAPGAYAEDAPVRFLGGSHEVVFLVSELVELERGARIPFATIGDRPGHGHCGTAWRTSVGPEEPMRPDACETRGTAECI